MYVCVYMYTGFLCSQNLVIRNYSVAEIHFFSAFMLLVGQRIHPVKVPPLQFTRVYLWGPS